MDFAPSSQFCPFRSTTLIRPPFHLLLATLSRSGDSREVTTHAHNVSETGRQSGSIPRTVQAGREGDSRVVSVVVEASDREEGGGIGALLFMVYIPVHVVKE